ARAPVATRQAADRRPRRGGVAAECAATIGRRARRRTSVSLRLTRPGRDMSPVFRLCLTGTLRVADRSSGTHLRGQKPSSRTHGRGGRTMKNEIKKGLLVGWAGMGLLAFTLATSPARAAEPSSNPMAPTAGGAVPQ